MSASKRRYEPVYTVSGKAMNMIAEIAAAVERYRLLLEGPGGVRLRKLNHIRTIRGTTAIEGNTLTEKQITALLSGKRVAGTKREIDEVKGAHEAYSAIESFNPYLKEDLLKAHGIMMKGLAENPGAWRRCDVGVMGSDGSIAHMAPPYENVPGLMGDLFRWLSDSEDPVLVKSCVFHYEFEFIHPFVDGNGRTGRLWQTALLGSWRKEFYGAQVENIVWAHQQEYYRAIQESTAKGDAGAFIDFMLDKILRTLKAKGEAYTAEKSSQKSNQKSSQKNKDKILAAMKALPDITIANLAVATHLSVAGVKKIISKLKDANLVRRIGPDKGGHWEVG